VPGGVFEERDTALAPGDRLFLFTDGITEAFDAEGRPFGMAGLKTVLTRSQGRCAREILEDVLGAVGSHAGGHAQSDDMTLVVMRRL